VTISFSNNILHHAVWSMEYENSLSVLVLSYRWR